jgi:hypothetical protein
MASMWQNVASQPRINHTKKWRRRIRKKKIKSKTIMKERHKNRHHEFLSSSNVGLGPSTVGLEVCLDSNLGNYPIRGSYV